MLNLRKFGYLMLIICLLANQNGQAWAQVNSPSANPTASIPIGMSPVRLSITGALAAVPDNFKFDLLVYDVQTYGAITSATTQVGVQLLITNNTSNTYNSVSYSIPSLDVTDLKSSTADKLNVNFTIANDRLTPFFTKYVSITNTSSYLIFQNILPQNGAIIMEVPVTMSFTSPTNSTTVTYNLLVRQVIYMPSNADIIPMMYTQETAINNMQQTMLKKL